MKKVFVIAGFFLSILFLVLALKDTDFVEIRHAIEHAKLWPLLPLLLALVLSYWFKALRWSVLLSPSHTVSAVKLVPVMVAGAAGNNLLPAHFGELVKVYFAGNKFSIPKSTVLATLVLERLFDVLTVLVLFSTALLIGDYSNALYATATFLLMVSVLVLTGCILMMLYTEACAFFIENRVKFLPIGVRMKISEQVRNLGIGLRALRSKNLYVKVVVSSVLQWFFVAACIYSSLLAFDIHASPFHGFVILGLIVAGLTLPTSPGFFGTIEYCFVLGLATMGIDASTAISAAIYYHLPVWIIVTASGLLLFRVNRFSLKNKQIGSV